MFMKTSFPPFLRSSGCLCCCPEFFCCSTYLCVSSIFINREDKITTRKKKWRQYWLKFHAEKDLSRQFGSETSVKLMHGNDVQQYPVWKVNGKWLGFDAGFCYLCFVAYLLPQSSYSIISWSMTILLAATILGRLMDFWMQIGVF